MQLRKRLIYTVATVIAISLFAVAQSPVNLQPDGEPFFAPTLNLRAAAEAPSVNFTFATVDFPGADARQVARAIDDHGHIAGLYAGSAGPQGYLLQGIKFKPINFPGALSTAPSGMNLSTIVGIYQDAASTYHGFTFKHNAFSSIDYPGATLTALTGINAKGVIVGRYYVTSGDYHGFLLNAGVFSPIDFPSALNTSVFGINLSGEIVGIYQAADMTVHGFTLLNGVYTSVDFPGAVDTNLMAINDRGDMVGSYSTDSGAHYHGFLFKDGAFTSFDLPYVTSLMWTFPQGMNNKGQIVGDYYDVSGYHWGFSAQYQ